MLATQHPSTQATAGRAIPTRTLAPANTSKTYDARVIDATALVATEFGVREVTVAHIVSRAGVSRRALYELFDNGEECLLGRARSKPRMGSSTELADPRLMAPEIGS